MRCAHCGISDQVRGTRDQEFTKIDGAFVCSGCAFIHNDSPRTRLLEAMQFVACLSPLEALSCLSNYEDGLPFAGEAVNHFGGTIEVVHRAQEFMKTSATRGYDLSLPPEIRYATVRGCHICGDDVWPLEVYYRQAVFSWQLDAWLHVGCLLAHVFEDHSQGCTDQEYAAMLAMEEFRTVDDQLERRG